MTTQDLHDLKQLFEFAILTGDKPELTKSDCEMVVAAVDRVLLGKWVPWKPDDPLPPEGNYWCTTQDERGLILNYWRTHRESWKWAGVIAYWAVRLPAPYHPPEVSV